MEISNLLVFHDISTSYGNKNLYLLLRHVFSTNIVETYYLFTDKVRRYFVHSSPSGYKIEPKQYGNVCKRLSDFNGKATVGITAFV